MLDQSDGNVQANANEQISAVLASTPETETEAKYELSKTKRLGIGGWLAIGWLVFLVIFAVVVPLVLKQPTDKGSFQDKGFLKDLGHPFGGDDNGNDLTILLAEGVRNSLLIAFSAVGFGLVVGGGLGLIAGYFRGRLDTILSSIFNIFLAIPQFVLAISLITVLASNGVHADGTPAPASFTRRLLVIAFALGLVAIPILGRITRANTLQWSQREFVMASRAQGAKNLRIIVREVLPNVMPAMFSIALLGVAVAIVAEGGLAILGVGIGDKGWTLGLIIALGRQNLETVPHIVFEAVAFIFFTVLSLNYLGDVVRARFDVRESVL